jgi:hypothetical protein
VSIGRCAARGRYDDVMRGSLCLAVVGTLGCADAPEPVPEETTDGTFDIVFSEAMDTNMNIEPFAATQAHGRQFRAGYCSGGLHQTCYDWASLSLWGTDDITRRLEIGINISTAVAGVEKTFYGPSIYTYARIKDGLDPERSWAGRGWTAKSGTFRIDAVDGDVVTFTLEAVIMQPSYMGAGEETLGTFRVDGSGMIAIDRPE